MKKIRYIKTGSIAILVVFSVSLFAFLPASSKAFADGEEEIPGFWLLTGSLAQGRHTHTATLLLDGRVVVAGGMQDYLTDCPGLNSVEIYDPSVGMWDSAATLNQGRTNHTATLLENGKILVAGGKDSNIGDILDSAEIYDPDLDAWHTTIPLSSARTNHSATLLQNGTVLVAGGRFGDGPSVHASAEIFTPSTSTWAATGSLNNPREGHSATLLPDGSVLVIGGYNQGWLSSAEIFDPLEGTWSLLPPPLVCHGVAHTATLLTNGQVLVVGGACGSGSPGILQQAELFDPISLSWTMVQDLPEPREAHTATLLPNGMVLIVGGDDGDIPRYEHAIVFDPIQSRWKSTGSLNHARRNHTATLLHSGLVLVSGGWDDVIAHVDTSEEYHYHPLFFPIMFKK